MSYRTEQKIFKRKKKCKWLGKHFKKCKHFFFFSYQGNVNQNYFKCPSHSCRKMSSEIQMKTNVSRDAVQKEVLDTDRWVYSNATTQENSLELSENQIAICLSYATARHTPSELYILIQRNLNIHVHYLTHRIQEMKSTQMIINR